MCYKQDNTLQASYEKELSSGRIIQTHILGMITTKRGQGKQNA